MTFDDLCDRLFNSEGDFWESSPDTPWQETVGRDLQDRHSTPTALRNEARGQRHDRAGLGTETVGVPQTPMRVIDRPTMRRATRPEPQTRPNESASRRTRLRTLGLALLAFTMLGSACGLWKGYQAEHTTVRPIERFQVGERALVDAPKAASATDQARLAGREITWNPSDGGLEIEGVVDPLRQLANEASSADIKAADYRKVILRAQDVWEDGTVDVINIETLQPWQWIHQYEVHVGGWAPLPLDVDEMGLPAGMTGKVLDILPCPKVKPGRGRIILTTVNHLNNDVHELTLRDESGKEETLRPTGNHKFYSVSQGAWLSASELQAGETLDGVNGKIIVVSSREIPGTHRVYNFTVQGEHLYRVANCGVLVHNNYCSIDVGKLASKGTLRERLTDVFLENGVDIRTQEFLIHGTSSRFLDDSGKAFAHNGKSDLFGAVDLDVIKHFGARNVVKAGGGQIDGVVLSLDRKLFNQMLGDGRIIRKEIDDMAGKVEFILTPSAANAVNRQGKWIRLTPEFFKQ